MKSHQLALLNSGLTVLLILFLAIGAWNSYSLQLALSPSSQPAPQAQVKAPIPQVKTIVLTTDCTSCFDMNKAVSALSQFGVNVTDKSQLAVTSPEGKALVQKYGITKAPTLLILGDTKTLENSPLAKVLRTSSDSKVFEPTTPPYVDIMTSKTVGLVDAIILQDNSCKECRNLSNAIRQLQQTGIVFTSERSIDSASDEGKRLITDYNIEQVPTVLLSNDALQYSIVRDAWNASGTIETNGRLVLRQVPPPFIDVKTGKTVGLVTATILKDSTCTSCLNTSVFKEVLDSALGVYVSQQKVFDVSSSEGKTLLATYNITLVPTVILNSEASVYQGMSQAWPQVGTKEKDGSYVWRDISVLKLGYKNLSDN